MRFLAGRLDLATRIGPKNVPEKVPRNGTQNCPTGGLVFMQNPLFSLVFAIPGPLEGTHFESTFGSISGRAKRARKIETMILGARSAPRIFPIS